MLKICHICNNYVSSKVHSKLVDNLSKNFDSTQCVYVPIRNILDVNKNRILSSDIEYHYSFCIKTGLKYLPLTKVIVVFLSFLKSFGFKKKSYFFIAHTLWSDGTIAFFYSLLTNSRYILVIRNTDMNIFLPRLKVYRFLINEVIKRSDGLVFVNKSYKSEFERKYSSLYASAKTTQVIYNGVEQYWLENLYYINKIRKKQICFVGRFDKNKNLSTIIKAVAEARKVDNEITLKLVGGSYQDLLKIIPLKYIPDWVNIEGKVEDINHLARIYRESRVFLMPSLLETFGLTYIEALTQGCPVIFTQGQGIDGIFNENIARPVSATNLTQISSEIIDLITQFPRGIDLKEIDLFLTNTFSWDSIASKYIGLTDYL